MLGSIVPLVDLNPRSLNGLSVLPDTSESLVGCKMLVGEASVVGHDDCVLRKGSASGPEVCDELRRTLADGADSDTLLNILVLLDLVAVILERYWLGIWGIGRVGCDGAWIW